MSILDDYEEQQQKNDMRRKILKLEQQQFENPVNSMIYSHQVPNPMIYTSQVERPIDPIIYSHQKGNGMVYPLQQQKTVNYINPPSYINPPIIIKQGIFFNVSNYFLIILYIKYTRI